MTLDVCLFMVHLLTLRLGSTDDLRAKSHAAESRVSARPTATPAPSLFFKPTSSHTTPNLAVCRRRHRYGLAPGLSLRASQCAYKLINTTTLRFCAASASSISVSLLVLGYRGLTGVRVARLHHSILPQDLSGMTRPGITVRGLRAAHLQEITREQHHGAML
ncbi:hypothetical protein BKA93DRAFT_562503 [Sparassis latifolia]